MSRIALEPDQNGSGVFTIASPNSNTSRTLTLPDAAGTVVTDSATQTLTNKTINASQLVDASITAAKLDGAQSGSAPIYAARAWVNFDGTTATPSTIRGSGNVSSVTRNGTGDYTVNFTTAMPDTDYVMSGTSGNLTGTTLTARTLNRNGSFTTTNARFLVQGNNSPLNDEYVGISVHR
jgi:hypothetical protein